MIEKSHRFMHIHTEDIMQHHPIESEGTIRVTSRAGTTIWTTEVLIQSRILFKFNNDTFFFCIYNFYCFNVLSVAIIERMGGPETIDLTNFIVHLIKKERSFLCFHLFAWTMQLFILFIRKFLITPTIVLKSNWMNGNFIWI